MVALSIIVSSYGLYQYLWGFDQLAAFISRSGSDASVTAPLLERVAVASRLLDFGTAGNTMGISRHGNSLSRRAVGSRQTDRKI